MKAQHAKPNAKAFWLRNNNAQRYADLDNNVLPWQICGETKISLAR